jgi:hypothetical protein
MWGASPLHLASYERFVDQLPQERVWQLLNVGYVVTWLDELAVPATVIHEEPVKNGEVTYLHRLDAEHPRVWTVYDAEVLTSEGEILDRLAQPDFDPYRTALLAEPPLAELPGRVAGPGRAQLVEFGPAYLRVEVDQAADGLLMLSEIDYPGWKAWLDGQPVPILKADAILRAVEVSAGQHRVEMAFWPWSVAVGLAISAGTLLLGLACVIWILLTHVGKANRK